MDDEDDVPYNSNTYAINGQKFPVENDSYPRNSYGEDDDNDDVDVDDDDDEEDDEKVEEEGNDDDGGDDDVNDDDDDDDDDGGNGVQRISKDDFEDGDDDDGDDNDDDNYGDQQKHPKKRKLKNLISSYEFAPRLPTPSPAPPRTSYGGRNPLTDWTEHETFNLLEAWGDRFLKHGRKSLRSEEWQEVAEKVSQDSKNERTDTQCRNRLDTLKKKYKKEKSKVGEHTEWVYFKKMDSLLSSSHPPRDGPGLSCGVDSGEYVFMNPKVYLNCSNGLDEMRDSPGNSTEGEEEEEMERGKKVKTTSFKMVADSFKKFGEIYERIESSKRQQMVELEKMRMDFHADLELQKRKILERAQAEIAKIRRGVVDDEDNGVSNENISG